MAERNRDEFEPDDEPEDEPEDEPGDDYVDELDGEFDADSDEGTGAALPTAGEGVDARRRTELRVLCEKLAKLTQYVARESLGAEEARDLGQEVTHAYFERKKDDPALTDVKAARALAWQIARYQMIDRLRANEAQERHLNEWETTRAELLARRDDPWAQLESRELFEIVGRRLNLMSRDARDVFLLRRMDGISISEIAERLHLKLSTAKKHLLRATERLRLDFVDYLG